MGQVTGGELRLATAAEVEEHVNVGKVEDAVYIGDNLYVPVWGKPARRAQALVRFDEAAARDWLARDEGGYADDGDEGFEARYLNYVDTAEDNELGHHDEMVYAWSERERGFGDVEVSVIIDRYRADGEPSWVLVLVNVNPDSNHPLRVASGWTEVRKVDGLSIDDDRPVLDRLVAFLGWVAGEARGAVGCAFAAIDEL